MNHMKTLIVPVVAGPALAAMVAGCQNDGGDTGTASEGRVVSQPRRQDVTPGGTAIQTRTQVRETPSGERVRETEMRTREVVTPERNPNGATSDPGTR